MYTEFRVTLQLSGFQTNIISYTYLVRALYLVSLCSTVNTNSVESVVKHICLQFAGLTDKLVMGLCVIGVVKRHWPFS